MRCIFLARIVDGVEKNITGKRIKEARKKARLAQQELSKKLELEAVYVCRDSVSRIESGLRSVTDIEIDVISRILNVSFDYLFGRE